MALSIHAIWLIDEYAKIFRKLDWLIPIIPLTNILKIIIVKKKYWKFILYIIKTMGVIFCHVNRIKQFNQFKPSITSGNQKWNGAIPIFVSKAELKIIIIELSIFFRSRCELASIIIENKRIKEAKAWVRKYFIELSVERIFLLCWINGMNANKLISKPNHIPIQVNEEIEINLPVNRIIKNKIL